MACTVAEHGPFGDTTEAYAQGFRTVSVGQGGRDSHQFDRAALRPLVELVAVVVALPVHSVQIGHAQASLGHLGHVLVHLDVRAAQVGDATVADLDVQVIAAWAGLVGMVDLDRVVAAGVRGKGPRHLATSTPGGSDHSLAADGDHEAVVGSAAEGVGLAGFEVDQA